MGAGEIIVGMDLDRRLPNAEPDERGCLVGWLEWLRATVHVKCAGLPDELAHEALVPASKLTVGSLVSHLRFAEWHWFTRSFLGEDEGGYSDGGWRVADESLQELLSAYDTQCAQSRATVDSHELGEQEAYAPPGTELVSLRWILGHMIEETARHLGHLDLLRESADGSRGY